MVAGKRTARGPFQGETWSDKNGKTFALDHDGVRVRVRFLDDGKISIAILGAPPMVIDREMLGKRTEKSWAKVVMKPAS
jgi:hypothetical protein